MAEVRRDKSLAQYMKALSGWNPESISMDFHELPAPVPQAQVRQDFNPPKPSEQIHRREGNDD
jgi:hypothetical protein